MGKSLQLQSCGQKLVAGVEVQLLGPKISSTGSQLTLQLSQFAHLQAFLRAEFGKAWATVNTPIIYA